MRAEYDFSKAAKNPYADRGSNMSTPHPVELDHCKVRTAAELVAWALHEFRFGDRLPPSLEPERFIGAIFEHLLKNRLAFEVQELHVSQASPEVCALLDGENGWRQVLGFHLYRDSDNSSAYVFFRQAP